MTDTSRFFSAAAAALLLTFALLAAAAPAAADHSIAAIHARTAARYAAVEHIAPEKLKTLIGKSDQEPLVLDVREKGEYEVSRIGGAIRVDPGIWNWTFRRRYASLAKGRVVVLYCSVGVRSTKLAARVQKALKAAGAKAVYNLQGGLFSWHNRAKPLVDGDGTTDVIHPYNEYWGQLVERRDRISYEPR